VKLSRDQIQFHAGASSVLARTASSDSYWATKTQADALWRAYQRNRVVERDVRVKLLAYVQLAGGKIGAPGQLHELPALLARGLVALGRAELV
jgi:hypothetical protein